MISYKLKQAFRHLRKDKINSLINITGLTLGLSIVSLVAVFLINELNYNRSVSLRHRIYRVLNDNKNFKQLVSTTPYILGDYAKEQIPDIEQMVRVTYSSPIDVENEEQQIKTAQLLCADAGFFKMFNVGLLQGKVDQDFDQDASQVFISASFAKKCFGTEEALGKELIIPYKGNKKQMQVVGVFKDIPSNNSFRADIVGNNELGYERLLGSLVSTEENATAYFKEIYNSWEGDFVSTYLLLKEHADPHQVEQELARLNVNKQSGNDKALNLSLQVFDDIYFHSKEIIDNFNLEKGNLNMVYLLGVLGLVILLVACINYLNLASAQAFMRAKSLSVHWVFGGKRLSLMGQMMIESVLLAFIALPFALLLAYLALPSLKLFLSHNVPLVFNTQMLITIGIIILITLLVGIVAGVLVSWKMSSLNVMAAMKHSAKNPGKKLTLNKVMLSFQFIVFIALLSFVFGIQKQVHYIMNADMGFQKEGLLMIEQGDKNNDVFAQEILKNPKIVSVSSCWLTPPSNSKMNVKVETPNGETNIFRGNMVGYDYVETMGMKVLAGVSFKKGQTAVGSVIVSESAAKQLDPNKDVIGKDYGFGTIVGMITDFKMSPLYEKSNAPILYLNPSNCSKTLVRFETKDSREVLAFLQKTWDRLDGKSSFKYQFTNELLAQIYQSDTRFAKLIAWLALISVVIGALGLFGLSLLMCQQKTKEIGIRKVNGASATKILIMLNSHYLRWVGISFIIASPIAYYAIQKWLEGFAYKNAISWWIFPIAGLLAMLIALLTVSWQSWRAATHNPVEALRCE